MARKKEFDREEVLTKAMYAFLHHGYEGTSMQTLVSAMGINRSSLYDTFGDKHSLFLAAIAHYEKTIVNHIISTLMAPDAGKQTIIDLFRNLIITMAQEEQCYGCLMTNTAIELCPHDAEAKSKIDLYFYQISQAFKQALLKAQARGELQLTHADSWHRQTEIDTLANYFTSSLQGLRVMGKVNRDLKTLNGIVDVILAVLN